jgi:preprotein translocase subunit SecE
MEPADPINEEKPGARRFEKARLFVTEVRNELKRVSWPSQREVYATTVVVIVTSLVLGLYLWGLDLLLDRIEFWILGITPR